MLPALLACASAPRTGPPPIVLVSLDTLRADRLGAYGNGDALTPNLDAFAAEAVVFTQAWSQAVQTAPSHTSLFTSRYPSEQVGDDRLPFVPADMPLLAQLLKLWEYQTGAFVGGADLSKYRGLNVGFDAYETSRDFGSLFHTTPPALAWLDAVDRDAPWFLFVHGYDAHTPYLKPPPYGFAHTGGAPGGAGLDAARRGTERIIDGFLYADFYPLVAAFDHEVRPRSAAGRARTSELAGMSEDSVPLTEADETYVRRVYDGAVSYADTLFGLLMAELDARGVLDEAVVVVLSDHGEQLGEHGLWGHCCEVNDEESHVPLLVRLPHGERGGTRVDATVELVDVMPTLLELAEIPPPAGIHGRSFAAALRGEPFAGRPRAFTQGTETMRTVSVRGPNGRLTYLGLSPTCEHLPDVVEAARHDGPGFLATEGLAEADRAELRAAMVEWLRTLSPSAGLGNRGEMPAALKKSLREHGYWDVAP
ncbi:MAG: sulfatase [Myxococcota bacterium]